MDRPGCNKAAENAEGPSAARSARLSASELRASLRKALAGYSAEARSAFLDGMALALEIGPDRIIAALEGADLDPAPSVLQGRAVLSDVALGDLVEQAKDALPPLPPGPPPVDPPGTTTLAGDPDRAWRRTGRYLDAYRMGGLFAPDGPEVLRGKDAAGLLDVWFAVMEWGAMALDPEVRAMAARGIEAGEAIRRGDKDAEGRAIPLGRLLGIQPPAPTTAARKLDRKIRDDHLRKVRASIPDWRDVPARQAARLMIQSFERYRAGRWQADQDRETAPAVEPAATWWRISRLGLKVQMPGPEHLANILDSED